MCFKPEQEEALSKLLDGTSVFASLPTGAGKAEFTGRFPRSRIWSAFLYCRIEYFLSLSRFYNDYDKALLTFDYGKSQIKNRLL